MFRIEIKGQERVINLLSHIAPQLIQIYFREAMEKSVTTLEASIKDKTPVFTGQLRSSITSRVEGIGANIEGIVGTNVHYAPYVEFGTRPHFPPVSALERWCALVLGDSSLAWAVAKAISKRGTKARKMFEMAINENLDNIKRWFSEALLNMVTDLRGR